MNPPAAGEGTSDLSSPPPPSPVQHAGQATSSSTSSNNKQQTTTKPEDELLGIRREFVKRVSDPLINGLLDDLLHHKVLNFEEKDFVMNQKVEADRARQLIDTVLRKGERASQTMINYMKVRDSHLCSTLGLISSPTG
ncbi:unnamed protein product [Boreogadus saida]